MQPVHWNDLQDFVAIARAGQLARAALSVGVDATTLGRRLRRLETALGQTLFEQTREGQILTEAGEKLLAQAELMQQTADQIQEHRVKPGQLSGLLRISVSEGFGTWFVAQYLHEFVDRYPELTVDLVASNGFLNPSKREADLAVMLARPRAGPVVSNKLSDYRLRLYASRDYAGRQGAPISRDDLRGLRLIGYIPDLLYAPELHYLNEIDDALLPRVRSSSILAQQRLIGSGIGVGVLPCFIGDADPALVRVLPEIAIDRNFWIVTHRDTGQLQRVRAFRNWLTALVQAHQAQLAGELVAPR